MSDEIRCLAYSAQIKELAEGFCELNADLCMVVLAESAAEAAGKAGAGFQGFFNCNDKEIEVVIKKVKEQDNG